VASRHHRQLKKLWPAVPALATIPALWAEPKWRAFYVVAVFFAAPFALVVRNAKPWLFLICALSAFNFSMIVGEHPIDARLSAFEVTAIDIPIVALMCMALAARASRVHPDERPDPALLRTLTFGALFVAWVFVGALTASRPDVVIAQSVHYLRLVLAVTVVATCARIPGGIRWGLSGLSVALAAQSVIAIGQYFTGSSFGFYGHFDEETSVGFFTRSGGTLNPTVLSEYVGVVAPLVLAAGAASTRRWTTGVLLALFGAAALAGVLTLSRGGLISVLISTLLLVAFISLRGDVSRGRKVFFISATLVTAIALAAAFGGPMMARVAEVNEEVEGDSGRLSQFRQAGAMIVDNPITGVGLGNYVDVMGHYGPTLPFPVHNKFLLVTAETGIPGGCLYIALWLSSLVVFARGALRLRGPDALFCAGAAAALFATLVNMNADVYSTAAAPELALFLVTGLGLAGIRNGHCRARATSDPRPGKDAKRLAE
jgi:O-antigen ligase